MIDVIAWLLGGEPYIEYNTRVNLLEQKATEPKVIAAKKKLIEEPKIQLLLEELKNWPNKILNSHKNASHPFHKLSFIADIGLTKDDPDVPMVAEKIFMHQSKEGPFQVLTNIPKHSAARGRTLGRGRFVMRQSSHIL